MNELSLLAFLVIGLLAGILLALLAVAVLLLWRAANKFQQQLDRVQAATNDALHSVTNNLAIFRGDVTRSLGNLDADRLHDASFQIQSSNKSLKELVASLQSLIYAQNGIDPSRINVGTESTSLFPSSYGLDDEAQDDARMLQDRERWQREAMQRQQQAAIPFRQPTGSTPPVAGYSGYTPVTDEEREAFWQHRRDQEARAKAAVGLEPMAPLPGEGATAVDTIAFSTAPDIHQAFQQDLTEPGRGVPGEMDEAGDIPGTF